MLALDVQSLLFIMLVTVMVISERCSSSNVILEHIYLRACVRVCLRMIDAHNMFKIIVIMVAHASSLLGGILVHYVTVVLPLHLFVDR